MNNEADSIALAASRTKRSRRGEAIFVCFMLYSVNNAA